MIEDEDFGDEFDDPYGDLLEEEETEARFTPQGVAIDEPAWDQPIEPATTENFVCLRGPCKFYMELTKKFKHGNKSMPDDFNPLQTVRFCTAIPGYPLELDNEVLYECNYWKPIGHPEKAARKQDRDWWENKKAKDQSDTDTTDCT